MSDLDTFFGTTPKASAVDSDVDKVVRTVYGEASNQGAEGHQAVAAVIRNRALNSGRGYGEVVAEKGQFEPWSDPKAKARMLALRQDDPAYQAILANVQPVLNGDVDPTGGADHFYSPKTQAALGRPKPSWDNGAGQDIGDHRFFRIGAKMQDDMDTFFGGALAAAPAPATRNAPQPAQNASAQFLQGAEGAPAPAEAPADESASAKFLSDVGAAKPEQNVLPINKDTKVGLPAAQAKTFRQLAVGGGIDPDAQVGTIKLPYVQVKAGVAPSGPGVYYVDLEGRLQQTPGEPVSTGEAIGKGFVQGARDVNASVNNLANAIDSRVPLSKGINRLIGYDAEKATAQDFVAREGFESRFQDIGSATGGRIAGQVAASTPLMLAGGELLAPVARAAGPVGEFLAGRAGGNLLTQTASRATQGAIQGGAGGALTSGQSDRPVGEQVATGALIGGVAGPVVPAVTGLVGRGVNSLTQSPVATEIADLARVAMDKWKIPLRSGQIAGTADRAAGIADSNLIGATGSGYGRNAADQGRAFTRAVSSTIGEDVDAITPEVMLAAKRRIGGNMNDIAARNSIRVDDDMLNELAAVGSQAREIGLDTGQVNAIDKQIDKIVELASKNDGVIPGDAYQAITGFKSSLQKMQANENGTFSNLANEIRDALDGGLERSASAEDIAALRRARYEYKNLKTIEGLVTKDMAGGQISPAQLLGKVQAKYGDLAYSGGGDLGELAQIGQKFMKEPPNSGTAARSAEMLKRHGVSGLLGGGGLLTLGLNQPEIAAKMVAAGIAAEAARVGNNALQGGLKNNPGLTNRLLSSSTGSAPSAAARLMGSPHAAALGKAAEKAAFPVVTVGGNRLAQPSR